MTNEVMVLDAPQALTEKQQSAWLGMANQKNALTSQLQGLELKAQAILLISGASTYAEIELALAAFRKAHTEISETRLAFTSMVDAGIIKPLMAYEKRIDPKGNEAYIALTAKSLTLRKAEAERANTQNLKNQTAASFKAHCANEFYKAGEYLRSSLRKEISNQYQLHLTQKIAPTLPKIKELLQTIKPQGNSKFITTILSNEELGAIYAELTKPNFEAIYQDAYLVVNTMFANFDSDLANAAAAIAHQLEVEQLAEAHATTQMAEEMAINTLIATSEAVIIDTPKIKTTLVITVIESEQWAKAIMAAFITNMHHMGKYIKVKSWSKLTLGQMAEYLGKYSTESGHQIANLIYTEMEK